MARHSLTWRLTLSFTVVMTLLLLASATAVYFGVRFSLDRGLRSDLARQADELHRIVLDQEDLTRQGNAALRDRADSYALVLDASTGDAIAATPPLQDKRLLTTNQLATASTGRHMFDRGSISDLDRHTFRIATRATRQRGRATWVEVVAVRRDARDEALRELLGQLAIAGFATLCLTALVGYRLTRAALRPVEQLRSQASELYESGTGDRLVVPATGDELARLAHTLNQMLARVDAAIDRERAFSASASHELRTPLTLLTTRIELALRRPRTNDELLAALLGAGTDVDRLIRIVEDLLHIAHGERRTTPANIAVKPLVQRVIDRVIPALGPDRRITASVDSNIEVAGHETLIESSLENLLINAIRHGDGDVQVTVRPRVDAIEIHVTDEGPGFPLEFIDHAFERFARARTGGTEGAGLGLAIVAAAMASQDGSAHAANLPDGGADVWISLPPATST